MNHTPNTLTKTKAKPSNTLFKAKIIILVGVILIVVSPLLFTLHSSYPRLDFTKTGEIGETIGGITSPIISLLGFVLIYLALTAQVEANGFVQTQLDEEKTKANLENQSTEINQLYRNLKDSIDHFSFFSLDSDEFGQGEYLTGSEAIYKLFNDFYCDNSHLSTSSLLANPKITELISILEICNALLIKIDKSSILTKDVIRTLTSHQFRYRVFPRLNSEMNNLSKHHCPACDKEHGLPDELVSLIKNLDNLTTIIPISGSF